LVKESIYHIGEQITALPGADAVFCMVGQKYEMFLFLFTAYIDATMEF